MSTRYSLSLVLVALALFGQPALGQTEEKFYFWVDSKFNSGASKSDSFVIEVNAAIKGEIEAVWARGEPPSFVGRIAARPAEYNRDYYKPGHPVWNWHVTAVEQIVVLEGIFDASVQPPRDGSPSAIAADPDKWIASYGDRIGLRHYYIRSQIDPSAREAVVNVSNRAMAGAGEKAVITGVIVRGGKPRTIVVRALGPSLSAAGVQQVAANPKIEVFQGRARIATNTDWKTGSRALTLAEHYPALAPPNDNEAALLLTLLPGTYTLHGTNEEPGEGVILLEAYDVDDNLSRP
jgi:hypothetical protein